MAFDNRQIELLATIAFAGLITAVATPVVASLDVSRPVGILLLVSSVVACCAVAWLVLNIVNIIEYWRHRW